MDEIQLLKKYQKRHRLVFYLILAFCAFLTYLLIVISQQVSNEQALKMQSKGFYEYNLENPSINDSTNQDTNNRDTSYTTDNSTTDAVACSAVIDWGWDSTVQIGGLCWRSLRTITCSNGTVFNNPQVPPGGGGCWTKERWQKEANSKSCCSNTGVTQPTQIPPGEQVEQPTGDCDLTSCMASFACDKIEFPPTAVCSVQNSCYGGGYYKSLRYRCIGSSTRVVRWRTYSPGGCRTGCDLYKEAAQLCGCTF